MNRKTKKSENTGNGISIWHIVIAIAYIICTGFVYYTTSSNTSYNFRLTYGDNPSTTAQLYYDTGESFVETQSIKVDFTDQQAVFVLNDAIRENSITYRIDPSARSRSLPPFPFVHFLSYEITKISKHTREKTF